MYVGKNNNKSNYSEQNFSIVSSYKENEIVQRLISVII